MFRDKAGEEYGWGFDEYSLNAMFSEESLPLLADSECNLVNKTELSCVSQEIEGILVNYGTSPATKSGITATIDFICRPKAKL